jgi:hypothetical protein
MGEIKEIIEPAKRLIWAELQHHSTGAVGVSSVLSKITSKSSTVVTQITAREPNAPTTNRTSNSLIKNVTNGFMGSDSTHRKNLLFEHDYSIDECFSQNSSTFRLWPSLPPQTSCGVCGRLGDEDLA